MEFYGKIFFGFYCMVKKFLPREKNPEAFAAGFLSGAVSFVYFALTSLFLQRGASALETVFVFSAIYAVHHYLFVKGEKYKQLEIKMECSDRLIYVSLLFFFSALSLLMYVSTLLGKG